MHQQCIPVLKPDGIALEGKVAQGNDIASAGVLLPGSFLYRPLEGKGLRGVVCQGQRYDLGVLVRLAGT